MWFVLQFTYKPNKRFHYYLSSVTASAQHTLLFKYNEVDSVAPKVFQASLLLPVIMCYIVVCSFRLQL